MDGRPAPRTRIPHADAQSSAPARLRRERRRRAEARLRLQLVRDGAALAGHRGGPAAGAMPSRPDVSSEIAAIRASLASLASRLDTLLRSSVGTATEHEPCGPLRGEGVPDVVQGGGAMLSEAPRLGLSAGQGGQGHAAVATTNAQADAYISSAAPAAKRAKSSGQNASSKWEVLPFRSPQYIHVSPSFSAATTSTLQFGEVLEGILVGTDGCGIDWLQLVAERGYVAAAVAEQQLPGMPLFPAQHRLGRFPETERRGCGE